MEVRHWNVAGIKAEHFAGESQLQVLTAVYTWAQLNPGLSILNIRCETIDEDECMTIFYE